MRERTREERRSLFLHQRVAQVVAADPDGSSARARRTLETMRSANEDGSSRRELDAWEQLLAGPLEPVLEVLTGDGAECAELRAASPFAGVLPARERWAAYRAFREHDSGAA